MLTKPKTNLAGTVERTARRRSFVGEKVCGREPVVALMTNSDNEQTMTAAANPDSEDRRRDAMT